MPEHIARAITGHTRGSDHHSKYGSNVSLRKQLEWLAKVDPLKD